MVLAYPLYKLSRLDLLNNSDFLPPLDTKYLYLGQTFSDPINDYFVSTKP